MVGSVGVVVHWPCLSLLSNSDTVTVDAKCIHMHSGTSERRKDKTIHAQVVDLPWEVV